MAKKDYRFQKLNKITNRLEGEIFYIYNDAIKSHRTSEEIMESIKARVWDSKDCGELPDYMRYGLRKYEQALSNYLWRNHLEWVHWYDGKFVHKNLPYGEGFRQDLIDKSAHVWAGTEIIYFHSEKTLQNG